MTETFLATCKKKKKKNLQSNVCSPTWPLEVSKPLQYPAPEILSFFPKAILDTNIKTAGNTSPALLLNYP